MIEVRIELDYNDIPLGDVARCYSDFYKNQGINFDYATGTIYYDVDLPFMPIEGQRLGTKFGMCLVTWAIYNIHSAESKNPADRTKIIVSEE